MKQTNAPATNPEQTSGFYTGSKKVFVKGQLHPIRVAMREIHVTPTLVRS